MRYIDNYVKLFERYGGKTIAEKDLVQAIIPVENLVEVSSRIFNEMGAMYRTCIGMDERPLNGLFSIIHVFTDNRAGLYISVKTYLDPDKPIAPSISKEIPAAEWCELETRDLLGIEFEGVREGRLVLPDWWPRDIYPLRKDVEYSFRPTPQVHYAKFVKPVETGIVPLGPYHPALHEPEYFELYVEGEKIVDVRYRGFHVHRGIEKLAESRMSYQQVCFLAERICGICGFEHSTCYALAVEKAGKLEVPERAQFIRGVVLEIERIHSHLLWLGVIFHLLGYDTGFMHTWRIREKVMYLAELLTGSRKTYGINIIGGVRKDVSEEKKQKVIENLAELDKEFAQVIDIALSVPQVKKRLSGTGVLSKKDALKLCVEGPVARASGLNVDARRDLPYASYKYVYFKIPVYTEGDCLARALVRIDEIRESINIIQQLLDTMPKGPISLDTYEIPEGRVGIQVVEAPRGGNVHYVVTGRGRPYRWRIRAPTYSNIPALRVMLKDQPLADAPLIIASIDPCFSCTDRILVLSKKP
ncbi:MAG: NADH-quinone oxidoreductase subunit C [Desulfurococcaceae archaeon]